MAVQFIKRKYHDSDVYVVCAADEKHILADSATPSTTLSATHSPTHSPPRAVLSRPEPGGCPVCQARRATKAKAQARLRARRAAVSKPA